MSGRLNDNISRIGRRITSAVRSSRGRDVLLYLVCVCIAFVFWVFLSLESEVQRDYEIPIEITGVPDSVIIISAIPPHINTIVVAKEAQLLRHTWGSAPVMKLRFGDYIDSHDNFMVTRERLDSRLRDYFGQGVQITSVRPDSLSLVYTDNPGVRLPIHVNADITADMQYVINGAIRAHTDSAMVYSSRAIPSALKYLETEPIVIRDLRDTTTCVVRIKPIDGIRIIPDRIRLTIPVEPLIAKRRKLPVDIINCPPQVNIITFPSQVEVSYLVPMSAYNDDYALSATADYLSVDRNSDKIALHVPHIPVIYHNLSLSPDSVEFVIEHRQ